MKQDSTGGARDDSKRTIVAGSLRPGADAPELRTLPNEPRHVRRCFARLKREGPVRVGDEAGPSGSDRFRPLTALDVPCQVLAPALTPRQPGDRIKTARRDAATRGRLFRAGRAPRSRAPTRPGRPPASCSGAGKRSRKISSAGGLASGSAWPAPGPCTARAGSGPSGPGPGSAVRGSLSPPGRAPAQRIGVRSNRGSPGARTCPERWRPGRRPRPPTSRGAGSAVAAGSTPARRCPCSPRSATSRASRIPANSWPPAGSFRARTPPGTARRGGASPRPATPTPGASGSRRAGPTGTRRGSGPPWPPGVRGSRRACSRTPGGRRAGSPGGPGLGSGPGSGPRAPSSPAPASGSAASGLSGPGGRRLGPRRRRQRTGRTEVAS